MQHIQLPADRLDYLQLTLPASGVVVRWGTRLTLFTVAAWDAAGNPTGWEVGDRSRLYCLSPDGEWVSVADPRTRPVEVTRVGDANPSAVVRRDGKLGNGWSAVAPGGVAVAWKDDAFTVVRGLSGGEEIARRKSAWGYDLQFSPGGRWLTEQGDGAFRVYDRTDSYRLAARIPTPGDTRVCVSDGNTGAATNSRQGTVSVWDLSANDETSVFSVGGGVSAVAISADGRRVLTGNTDGDAALWDAGGQLIRRYAWGVSSLISAAFAADGTRAAVGGSDGRVVVWDLDE